MKRTDPAIGVLGQLHAPTPATPRSRAWVAFALASLVMFSGCVGPGLEPPGSRGSVADSKTEDAGVTVDAGTPPQAGSGGAGTAPSAMDAGVNEDLNGGSDDGGAEDAGAEAP